MIHLDAVVCALKAARESLSRGEDQWLAYEAAKKEITRATWECADYQVVTNAIDLLVDMEFKKLMSESVIA